MHNDRAGEVGRTLSVADFDLDRIFGTEGVQILHLSGVIAALSPEASTFCLELARAARRHGTRISFDINHRASFWEGREEELGAVFAEIASVSDILIGNEEDFQLALGIPGPEAGGEDLSSKIDGFKEMIARVQQAYPNASWFANTLREVVSANQHLWGGLIYADGQFHIAEPREIGVLDRIGGGDGFVGGMLYGILRGWEPERCLQFGWASGALAATFLTDYARAGRRGPGLEHLGRQRARAPLNPRPTRDEREAEHAPGSAREHRPPGRASSSPSTRGRDSSSARVTQRASSASSPGTGSGAGTCRGRSR